MLAGYTASGISAEELAAVQAVADRYPMCITPYYLGLIDPNDPDDAEALATYKEKFQAECKELADLIENLFGSSDPEEPEERILEGIFKLTADFFHTVDNCIHIIALFDACFSTLKII